MRHIDRTSVLSDAQRNSYLDGHISEDKATISSTCYSPCACHSAWDTEATGSVEAGARSISSQNMQIFSEPAESVCLTCQGSDLLTNLEGAFLINERKRQNIQTQQFQAREIQNQFKAREFRTNVLLPFSSILILWLGEESDKAKCTEY